MKKIISKFVAAIIVAAGLPSIVGCDNGEYGDLVVNVIDDEGKELTDVPGRIVLMEGERYFNVDEGYRGPYAMGACHGSSIKIKNWKPEYEEYKGKCLVSGVFKTIGSVCAPTHSLVYAELTISSIRHFEE